MRVAMPVLSMASYGGESYLRSFLPAVERYAQDTEFLLLASEDTPLPGVTGRNVKIVMVPAPKRGGRYVRVLWEQWVLPKLIRRMDVDVVYTASNVGILRSAKPCVIAVRNMDPLVPKEKRESPLLYFNSVLRTVLSRASLRAAKRIVAVSNYVRQVLITLGVDPAKIDVIYHGIDDLQNPDNHGATCSDAPPPYIASASKFIRYANLTTLVLAYHRMRLRGFKGALLVAGGSLDGRYEKEVRCLVAKLELSQDVRFLGYISRGEVQSLIRGCSVFLFPSKLEACPFTLLEALRQGAPIVTSNAGPMREICGDAAVYVDPADATGFGDAAYELAMAAELQMALREKARARSGLFRWEDSVTRLVETLKRAACGS